MLNFIKYSKILSITIFVFLAAGCVATSSIKGTRVSEEMKGPINDLLFVHHLNSFDDRYRTKLSNEFNRLAKSAFEERGIRTEILAIDPLNLEPGVIEKSASQNKFNYLIILKPIHATLYEGSLSKAEFEARLWRRDGKKQLWIGTFTWVRGGAIMMDSHEKQAADLLNLVTQALESDNVVRYAPPITIKK